MLPFDFTVTGPPISHQAKNRNHLKAWQARVSAAAKARLPAGFAPVTYNVTLRITYYYDGDPLDADNMAKPIQDALIGVVYLNDNQVSHLDVIKTSFDGSFTIKRGVSPVLVSAFGNNEEFLHIAVERAPDIHELK